MFSFVFMACFSALFLFQIAQFSTGTWRNDSIFQSKILNWPSSRRQHDVIDVTPIEIK